MTSSTLTMGSGLPEGKRSGCLDDKKWNILLRRIANDRCTPFLGPETCFDSVPPASKIAHEWAFKHGYPLEDCHNLPRVAQFRVVQDGDDNAVREDLADLFRRLKPPDFDDPREPHRVLASLPLSTYIVTHYYAFMYKALVAQRKDPRRDWCRWRELTDLDDTSGIDGSFSPTVANPLVFYLYGYIDEPRSIVLTEDDYLDFLVKTSEEPGLIPPIIQKPISRNSLLFLGYRFEDLDFRVILRKLFSTPVWGQNTSMSVQMITVGDSPAREQLERAEEFLRGYGTTVKLDVYVGSTRQFLAELMERWEDYNAAAADAR